MILDFGYVELSYEFLLGLLQLDDGELQAVSDDMGRRVIRLRIKHPDFPRLRLYPTTNMIPMQVTFMEKSCGHTCDLGSHKESIREPFTKWGTSIYR